MLNVRMAVVTNLNLSYPGDIRGDAPSSLERYLTEAGGGVGEGAATDVGV